MGEEAIASVRREVRVDQAEQERRAQATQLTLSLLRTDLSALKLSHEEALKDIEPAGCKAALEDTAGKLTGASHQEALLRRSHQQELRAMREQIEREHIAVKRQLAVLWQRVDACEHAGMGSLSGRFDEPFRLRGNVEALMTKSNTASQRTTSHQSLPAWSPSANSEGASSSMSQGQMASARQQLQDSTCLICFGSGVNSLSGKMVQ